MYDACSRVVKADGTVAPCSGGRRYYAVDIKKRGSGFKYQVSGKAVHLLPTKNLKLETCNLKRATPGRYTRRTRRADKQKTLTVDNLKEEGAYEH
jgi:hypothetical protein